MTVKPGWARKRDRLRRRESDATRAGAAAQPEPDAAAPEAEGPPWALSAAEWRLLVITFVGGLGSIVAGAGILGVAIAIARNASGGPGIWFFYTLVTAVMCVVTVKWVGPALWGVGLGHLSAPARLYVLVFSWIFVLVFAVGVALGLLALVGRAAGVK